MAEIHLQSLAHCYSGKPKSEDDYALKPMNHVWEDGKAYALLGPSGCGKSTLLNIISGLVEPSEGRVLFDGKDITHMPTEQRSIAQVFQFPVVYDNMTVFDNLAFPLRNKAKQKHGGGSRDKTSIKQRVEEIAQMLALDQELNRKAKGLSAEDKQKVSLGRGLVRENVAAILFDEPLTVIDPQLKWMLRMQLKSLHQQLNHTMIYVTHDQTEALTFADHVVVMHEGEVVQVGTPQELFDRPLHTFVGYFIGSPGMNVLPASVAGNKASLGSHEVALNHTHDSKLETNCELGIRPEFVELSEDPSDLPIEVISIEDIGRYQILHATLAGHTFNVLVKEGEAIKESHQWVKLNPKHVHIYQGGWLVEHEA